MLETKFLRVQVEEEEKQQLEKEAQEKGFKTTSDYIREKLVKNNLSQNMLKEIKEVLEEQNGNDTGHTNKSNPTSIRNYKEQSSNKRI